MPLGIGDCRRDGGDDKRGEQRRDQGDTFDGQKVPPSADAGHSAGER